MNVLFVHGMGRSPMSGILLARRLHRVGHRMHGVGYAVTFEDVAAVRDRIVDRITRLAAAGPYALIGHSLGGVLLRAALARLPAELPLPHVLFLLGSPVQAVRPAMRLAHLRWYRLLTRESGQLLASPAAMASLGTPPVRTIAIAGAGGWWPTAARVQRVRHDGVVTLDEIGSHWLDELHVVPVPHSFLPMSRHASDLVLARLAELAHAPALPD